jgi:hypothetical protein
MEKNRQEGPPLKRRTKDNEERLWDYMLKTVKETQRNELQQIGI